MKVRGAKVADAPDITVQKLKAYMPANYNVIVGPDGSFYVVGIDMAGWTMDDYIIPRLASGLIWAQEVTA